MHAYAVSHPRNPYTHLNMPSFVHLCMPAGKRTKVIGSRRVRELEIDGFTI